MKFWKKILAFSLLALPAALPAQWAAYHSSGWPHTLLDAPGGGWVIACSRNIFKLSPSGEVVWGQRFDGGTPSVYCRKAWLAPDDGIVAAADEGYAGTAMLFKLSASGSVVWQKTYLPGQNGHINVFCPMPDGGAIMAGDLDSDLLLLRCSANGEIVWQKSYKTLVDAETATAAVATSDGGVLVLGSIVPAGGGSSMIRLWVMKLTSAGEIEWQEYIGGDGVDIGDSVLQTADGGYLVAGHTSSFDAEGRSLFWLMKLSPTGAILRQLTLNYVSGGQGWLSVRPAADGSSIAAIRPSSTGAPAQAVIVTIGQDGAIVREVPYDVDCVALTDVALALTADGGCLLSLTGESGYPDAALDAHVMKLLPSGGIEWHKVYGSAYSPDAISLLGRAEGGGYIMAGHTSSWGGLQDALWVMKTFPDGSISPSCYFIRSEAVEPVEETSTMMEISANVVDTEAVSEGTSLVAQPVSISFVPWGSTTLRALGKLISTLKISCGEGGTTEPSAGNHIYEAGHEVRISAEPKAKYNFLDWSGNISLTRPSATIVMDGDKEIAASFNYIWDDLWEECFIATAAYGDPSHPDVEILRQFRDRYLMRSRTGRDLVSLYYRYSPPLARFVAKHPVLRAVSRAALSPAVSVCSWLLK